MALFSYAVTLMFCEKIQKCSIHSGLWGRQSLTSQLGLFSYILLHFETFICIFCLTLERKIALLKKKYNL